MEPVFTNNAVFTPGPDTNGFAWINGILYVIENGKAFPVEDERIKRVLSALNKPVTWHAREDDTYQTVNISCGSKE